MTPAERRLESILGEILGSRGIRYRAQHVISGKWIVDFFIPAVRLAIEVDGGIHARPEQRARDALKAADCARFDITLLRVSNREVFGDRDRLVERLRAGWREARRRPNRIIGRVFAADEPVRP